MGLPINYDKRTGHLRRWNCVGRNSGCLSWISFRAETSSGLSDCRFACLRSGRGVGLLLSAHFMVGTLILASVASAITTFTLMLYGQLFLNLNWSLVADITLVKIKIVSIMLRPSCRDCGLLSSYSESVSHALSVKSVVIKYCLCLICVP